MLNHTLIRRRDEYSHSCTEQHLSPYQKVYTRISTDKLRLMSYLVLGSFQQVPLTFRSLSRPDSWSLKQKLTGQPTRRANRLTISQLEFDPVPGSVVQNIKNSNCYLDRNKVHTIYTRTVYNVHPKKLDNLPKGSKRIQKGTPSRDQAITEPAAT